MRKKPFPSFQNEFDEQKPLNDLVSPHDFKIGNMTLIEVINKRIS
jgi:hypothetical protein